MWIKREGERENMRGERAKEEETERRKDVGQGEMKREGEKERLLKEKGMEPKNGRSEVERATEEGREEEG